MKFVGLFIFCALQFLACAAFADLAEITQKNAYEILGVASTASPAELQKAYRRLMMKYHPDRHKEGTADARIAEKNMKIVKASYEATQCADEYQALRIMSFFNGTLNSNSSESTQNGSRSQQGRYRPSAEETGSYQNYQQSNQNFSEWFQNLYDEFLKKQTAQSSKSTDLVVRKESLFDSEVMAIYENQTGLIIEVFSGDFYWIPTGSKVVYPILLSSAAYGSHGLNSLGKSFNKETSMFDPRLPGGHIPLIIREAQTLRVADLTFTRSQFFFPDELNRKLAKLGFRHFSDKKLDSNSLNLWNYNIFFDGATYTIVMMTSDLRLASSAETKVRMFVGTQDNMVEMPAHYNKIRRSVDVPGKGVYLHFPDSQSQYPIFDRATARYMGHLDMSDRPLQVFSNESSGLALYDPNGPQEKVPIIQIPALSKEMKKIFSVARLLGDLVDPPVVLKSPIDSIMEGFGRPKELTRIAGPAGTSNGSSAQVEIQKPNMAAEQFRIFEEMERARKDYPSLAPLLNFPNHDPRRTFAEIVIYEDADRKKLVDLTFTHVQDNDFALLLQRYVGDMKTWEEKLENLHLLELMVDKNLENNGVLAAFAAVNLRGMISHANDPALRRIILKMLKNNNRLIRYYLSNAFGGEDLLQDFINRYSCEFTLLGNEGSNSVEILPSFGHRYLKD